MLLQLHSEVIYKLQAADYEHYTTRNRLTRLTFQIECE